MHPGSCLDFFPLTLLGCRTSRIALPHFLSQPPLWALCWKSSLSLCWISIFVLCFTGLPHWLARGRSMNFVGWIVSDAMKGCRVSNMKFHLALSTRMGGRRQKGEKGKSLHRYACLQSIFKVRNYINCLTYIIFRSYFKTSWERLYKNGIIINSFVNNYPDSN